VVHGFHGSALNLDGAVNRSQPRQQQRYQRHSSPNS
jgi:hypothetical protein